MTDRRHNDNVILEKIANIEKIIEEIKLEFHEHREEQKKENKELNDRIKHIELWRAEFIGKFTAYSAMALFLGSIIGTILVNMITNYLTK